VRKVIANRAGGPEVLEVVDAPEPVPGPGQVTVRAEAVGVNFADVWARLGIEGEPPFAPGIEVAGTVVATGEGVHWPAIGDRVAATPFELAGSYAELVVTPAAYAFPVPDTIDSVTAAALPVNYLTGYAAIEQVARLRAGERVLVHAAAGGVGLACVQLARRRDVRLFATASAAKHPVLAEEGVDVAIDYRTRDWVTEIMQRTGDGVDVVVDGVGEDAFRRSLAVTRFGGRVVAYGFTAGVPGPSQPPADLEQALGAGPSPLELMSEARALMGVHMAAPPATMRRWWDELLDWHAAGEIRPRIDRTLPLADAADAHRRLHARENIGKLVLIP
jgi:NADPH:quinone reductase-like Zn-dependent oxidoreductase